MIVSLGEDRGYANATPIVHSPVQRLCPMRLLVVLVFPQRRTLEIPALPRQRQAGLCEIEDSQVCITSLGSQGYTASVQPCPAAMPNETPIAQPCPV